jgi:hypothetical protein
VLTSASSFDPAAVLLASTYVSVDVLKRLMDDDNIVGIIIGFGVPPSGPFSPAEAHPNYRYGVSPLPKHSWNPVGSGWALKDLKKPWFSLGRNDTELYLSRLAQSTARGTRLAVEFTLQMKTSTDSATCRKRGWCSDVGGVSLVASLSSGAELRAAKEVIVVMSSVDSNGIMQTRAPGAVSDMSGAVALVAAFHALGAAYGKATAQRPAVFHWFNAEAWGYIGSKQFVKWLTEGKAPYNVSSVFTMLEAKQVGSKTANAKLTVHASNNPASATLVSSLIDIGVGLQIPVAEFEDGVTTGLPPASVQSFLLKGISPATAILTDHGASYENPYYQSMFDTFENVDPVLVCNAAKLLAESVSQLQNYAQPRLVSVNCSFVTELLSCLSHDWRCPLFVSYLPFMANAPEFPSNYAGVFGGTASMRPPIKLLHDMITEINTPLVYPNKTCGRNADCFNNVDRYSCIRGKCLDKTFTYYWDAVAPQNESDASLPVFTESEWMYVGMRLFEEDSPITQIVGLFVGLILTAVATVVFLGVRNRISI